MSVEVLALDLEGTLISNAVSQLSRPGLVEFLEFCRQCVPRVTIYTTVEERVFREVASNLVARGEAPAWFASLPHLQLYGDLKDLRNIDGANVRSTLLVDDMATYVHPAQADQWVEIASFDPRSEREDCELNRVQAVIAERLRGVAKSQAAPIDHEGRC